MCKGLPYNIVNYTGEQQALLVLVGTFLIYVMSDSQLAPNRCPCTDHF